MKTSKEMLQGFYKSHTELSDDRKLSVQVLTTGLWPISRTTHSSCNATFRSKSQYYMRSTSHII
jgi:hypothetical protein